MSIGESLPIQLIQYANSQGSAGQNIETIVRRVERFAEIEKVNGFRTATDQTQLGRTKRFIVGFDFSLYPNANWKILFRGHEWTVQGIELKDEKQFQYVITAQEKGGS